MFSMSVNLVVLITTGVSFLGYCIFFDRKRLADPEYKKKLHQRRLQKARELALSQEEQESHDDDDAGADDVDVDDVDEQTLRQRQYQHRIRLETFIWMSAIRCLENPAILKRMFESEVQLGDRLLQSGQMDEGLEHLANAILLCKQPLDLLQSLQDTMPKELIHPLIIRVAEVLEESNEHDHSENQQAFSSTDSDWWISDSSDVRNPEPNEPRELID